MVLLAASILPLLYVFCIKRLVRVSHLLNRQKHVDGSARELARTMLFVACVEYVCFIACATQRPSSPSGTRVALCPGVRRDPGWGVPPSVAPRASLPREQSITKSLSVAILSGLSRLDLNRGTRNEVQGHAAASLSPQVLLLRGYPGELGKRGRAPQARAHRVPPPRGLAHARRPD